MEASGEGWGDLSSEARFSVQFENGNTLLSRADEKVTMFSNGEAFYYNPNSCIINDPKDSGVGFLIDPRVLGLTATYWSSVDLAMALRVGNRKEIVSLESESIDGFDCSVVQIVDHWNETKTFWVDTRNNFRVLKTKHETPGGSVAVTKSKFNGERDFFPKVVSTVKKSVNGKLQYDLTFKISGVNFDPPACSFDLSSLKMKAGTSVSDGRISQRLGYWDGERLQKSVPKSETPKPKEKIKGNNTWTWILGTALGIALISVATNLFRRIGGQ
jgi:hypothetical protein